jgi:hypothetical protein
VPHQRLRIQQLPVSPLFALHAKIIPDDRTQCRQTRYPNNGAVNLTV